MQSGIRLQKILSAAGRASRRAAEALIEAGRVSVNGVTVTALGSRADPARDDIRLDGRRVGLPTSRRYLVLNKPRGYVTTRRDPQHRKTVLDLIPDVADYVYPVGRLDYDSEGLLLLTNDGELAARLTHPRHGVPRVYEATVRGVPTEARLRRLAAGVPVDGRRAAPAGVRLLVNRFAKRTDESRLRIVLREGRNRQVRRMLEAIGHPVRRLRRVEMGPLRLGRLRPGAVRELAPAEVTALRQAAGKTAAPRRQRGGRRPRARPGAGNGQS
ncbi:MAG: pseudouridine synthase [Acidobacteria bacterium]|nr:pseudouridine synthase [Acidobacteriota bacterium]